MKRKTLITLNALLISVCLLVSGCQANESTNTTSIQNEEIDMESTLPGIEWIATLKGIIEEPKIVIFNDETNKKVIVDDGQSVSFENGDVFLVYTPNSEGIVMVSGIALTDIAPRNNYTIYTFNEEDLGDEIEIIITFWTQDTLSCTLQLGI